MVDFWSNKFLQRKITLIEYVGLGSVRCESFLVQVNFTSPMHCVTSGIIFSSGQLYITFDKKVMCLTVDNASSKDL